MKTLKGITISLVAILMACGLTASSAGAASPGKRAKNAAKCTHYVTYALDAFSADDVYGQMDAAKNIRGKCVAIYAAATQDWITGSYATVDEFVIGLVELSTVVYRITTTQWANAWTAGGYDYLTYEA